MIDKLIKTSLISFVGFAVLMTSCVSTRSNVQSQSSVNINSSQESIANKNSNFQNSSSASSNKKAIDYYAHLKPEHQEVLREWLKTKVYLRPAVEEIDNTMFQEQYYVNKEKYKETFEGNMKFLRETVGENGYQYYSILFHWRHES